MTDREALIHRIAGAIARKTASAAPAEVLAELSTTHVLVERERWERVTAFASRQFAEEFTDCDAWRNWRDAQLQPGDLDPIAASDTTETP
jgi:hypothetical protein